jgi:serine/threonine protein kinase
LNNFLDYVLELCPNGELFTHLKKVGSFEEKCASFYAAELLVAMTYIHDKGIVHRYNIIVVTEFSQGFKTRKCVVG